MSSLDQKYLLCIAFRLLIQQGCKVTDKAGKILFFNKPRAAGPAYFVLHPKKGITIWLFLNLPGLQKPGKESLIRQILLRDLRFDKQKYG